MNRRYLLFIYLFIKSYQLLQFMKNKKQIRFQNLPFIPVMELEYVRTFSPDQGM